MICSTEFRDDALLIRATGAADDAAAATFERALLSGVAAAATRDARLVLDLGGVDSLSGAGLAALVRLAKQARAQSVGVAVAALQPALLEIFQISRFDTIFAVHADVDAALAAAAGSRP